MNEDTELLIFRLHRLYNACMANDANAKIFKAMAIKLAESEREVKLIQLCANISNEYSVQNIMNLDTLYQIEEKLKEKGIEF